MWKSLWSFLAWAGLWHPDLIILNGDSPTVTSPVNATDVVDLTSLFMDRLLHHYATEQGRQVSYLALKQSHFYKQGFRQLGSLLLALDPLLLDPVERKTFFINVHNLLAIHAISSQTFLPEDTLSIPGFNTNYGYQVGAYTLHLHDIEHGILRGNRAHPSSGAVMFADDDPRMTLALAPDPRIHGVLNCGALSSPPLYALYAAHLEGQLNEALHTFANTSVKLSPDRILQINSIFHWFADDFGNTESVVLKWLAGQVTDPLISHGLNEASEGQNHFIYHYNWTLNAVSGAGGGKVKVEVYFSSLCTDTMRFFTKQLYPAWTELKDIMDLQLIPFGKARATPTGTGDYSFHCQHGDDECHGNKVMACVQNSFPIDTQVRMMHCMMDSSYPPFAGPQCSQQMGLDWAALERCSQGSTGSSLLYQHGVKTAALKPRLYFVPTVTIDGHYGQAQLRTSLRSLKSQICQYYNGPPHQNCV